MDAFHSYGVSTQTHQGKSLMTASADNAARPRLSAVAALGCLFGPCALFAAVSGALSFSLHYDFPGLCWFVVILAFATVVVCCYLAFKACALRLSEKVLKDPTFYLVLAISMAIAWGAGVFLGSVTYYTYTLPFNELQTLSSYPNVDVAKARGQQVMDAGRIVFAEGTRLDLTRSMGFKNLEEYCVAPITSGGTMVSGSVYDFWAVGLNCCSGNAADFHCGEYDNPRARSGLRLLREDQAPFYRLAVQQAEATFGIAAPHPIFFYWTQDAAAEAQSFQDDAEHYFLIGLLTHFFLQIVLVLVAVCVFTKKTS